MRGENAGGTPSWAGQAHVAACNQHGALDMEDPARNGSGQLVDALRRRRRFSYLQGGIPSADGKIIYFIALIDVLQDWNRWKKSENTIRSLTANTKPPEVARATLASTPFGEAWARKGTTISAIPPHEYAQRLQDFCRWHVFEATRGEASQGRQGGGTLSRRRQ